MSFHNNVKKLCARLLFLFKINQLEYSKRPYLSNRIIKGKGNGALYPKKNDCSI